MLSYRHAFHAGNHADVLKHAVLVDVLHHFNQKEKPWSYVDTHAGAGCYALEGAQAGQTEEFRGGIARLWGRSDLPPMLAQYVAAVAAFNTAGALRYYPGSPALAANCLRRDDRMRLFELHSTDAPRLGKYFRDDGRRVRVDQGDGFAALTSVLPPPSRRGVVLMDPSYEIKADYRRVAEALSEGLRRFATGTFILWYPLLQRPEARQLPERLLKLGPPSWLRAELSVHKPRPDGLGMQGSGLFVANPPWTLAEHLKPALAWMADALADDGTGQYRLDGQAP
ncbi:MAG: 23S rRNA (adenine(2030)-N(6))-methyltransferase RlmJ [Zoogloeaceae bacterium]|nr:23S rRNA (adenine(2030)-N(6))-methyltransferase RlmJ [Zoogloeaceae bacterium]